MKLSKLQELPSTRQMIDVFGGYNHNLRIGEGEFYDMKNLTSSDYPVLSPRPQRGLYSHPNADTLHDHDVVKLSNPQGLLEMGDYGSEQPLCCVDGSKIWINGYPIDMGLSTDARMCPKTLVPMGAYIIIMPDKKYINTTNYGDCGDIDVTFTSYYPDSDGTYTAAWTYFDLNILKGTN